MKKTWGRKPCIEIDLFSQLLKRIYCISVHCHLIRVVHQWHSQVCECFVIFSLDFESFGRSCFCRRRPWRWCRTPFGGSSWIASMWVQKEVILENPFLNRLIVKDFVIYSMFWAYRYVHSPAVKDSFLHQVRGLWKLRITCLFYILDMCINGTSS